MNDESTSAAQTGVPIPQPASRKVPFILMGLCVFTIVLCVGFLASQELQKKNIKVGTIVQAPFLGNPSMIQTAFIGLRGENALLISEQDQANLQSCDVPGAVGVLHSGWTSNGGIAWANPLDVNMCLSSSRFPFDSQTCSQASDCYVLHHMPCGSAEPNWQAEANGAGSPPAWPWSTQCSSNGGCSYTDATSQSGFCTIPSNSDLTQVSCIPGSEPNTNYCHYEGTDGQITVGGVTCAFKSCSTQNATTGEPSVGDCFSGQLCSYSSIWSGGLCIGAPIPHILVNVNMKAEGTVTSANSDGTFNVFWDHAQVLYPFEGPAPGWDYQQCVVTPSSDSYNTAARAVLFGQGGTWTEGATLTNPVGFGTAATSALPAFTIQWDSRISSGQQLDEIMPVVPDMSSVSSGTYSGWSLASNGIHPDSLSRITQHTIVPQPLSKVSAWTSQVAIGQVWAGSLTTDANPWR